VPDREDEARTELAEETGLRAESMRFLARLDNSHGLSTQSMHVFVATGLTAGEPAREVTEQDMRQKWVSRADFEQMILRVGIKADDLGPFGAKSGSVEVVHERVCRQRTCSLSRIRRT
jgi:hypothetical protein